METPRLTARGDNKRGARGDNPTLSCRTVASISTKVKEETPHLRSGRQKGEIRGDKKKAFGEIKGGVLGDKKGGRGHRDRGDSR
jgi:hypothetical protein